LPIISEDAPACGRIPPPAAPRPSQANRGLPRRYRPSPVGHPSPADTLRGLNAKRGRPPPACYLREAALSQAVSPATRARYAALGPPTSSRSVTLSINRPLVPRVASRSAYSRRPAPRAPSSSRPLPSRTVACQASRSEENSGHAARSREGVVFAHLVEPRAVLGAVRELGDWVLVAGARPELRRGERSFVLEARSPLLAPQPQMRPWP
jgi:hypothetical protein